MGAAALPPPGADQSQQGQPGPQASPAPGQPDQGGAAMAQAVMTIAQNARVIAMKVPAAVPEVRAINEALQSIQRKMIASQPAAEPQAPPV